MVLHIENEQNYSAQRDYQICETLLPYVIFPSKRQRVLLTDAQSPLMTYTGIEGRTETGT